MRDWFVRNWHYCGLTREEYREIQDAYQASNSGILRVAPFCAFVVTLFFLLLGHLDQVLSGNKVAYLLTGIINLAIGILAVQKKKQNSTLTSALVALFAFSVYFMGTYTGTVGTSDTLFVTYMIAIIVVPMIFYGTPAVMLGEVILSVILFVILVIKYETPQIVKIDVADAICCGLLSIVLNMHAYRTKARGFLAEKRGRENELALQKAIVEVETANDELHEGFQIFKSLGEIYASMYYIDLRTNRFTELTSISAIQSHIGQSGDAQERLNYFAKNMMLPEYTEEMLSFVDLSTMAQRMEQGKILTKEFRSLIFVDETATYKRNWREACFIDSGRDEAGNLTHVIFATRSIHAKKVLELEAKEQLQ